MLTHIDDSSGRCPLQGQTDSPPRSAPGGTDGQMAAGAQLRPALPSLARREPACMKPLDARSEPRSQPVSKDSLRKTVECKY